MKPKRVARDLEECCINQKNDEKKRSERCFLMCTDCSVRCSTCCLLVWAFLLLSTGFLIGSIFNQVTAQDDQQELGFSFPKAEGLKPESFEIIEYSNDVQIIESELPKSIEKAENAFEKAFSAIFGGVKKIFGTD
ncbi:unnamed protein product [Oikopleura dioica]|uniref:Uncharacterized protein n=1 Tax=Oikopleura dioica TaxID=34765 RepID=E4Y626_OIKDI|nr:unnamed protein product [Oikopleura dioica]